MYLNYWVHLVAYALPAAANVTETVQNVLFKVTPTSSRGSVITYPPVLPVNIFKRSIATCGYVRGNSVSPLICGNDYNCITSMGIQAAFACCNNIECPDNWGICQDYGQNNCQGSNLDPAVCSSIYGSILHCPQEAPSCFRYARSSALGDQMTYYSYACGTASAEVLVLATATNAGNQRAASTSSDEDSTDILSIPGLNTSPLGSESTSLRGENGNQNGKQNSDSGGKDSISTRSIVLIAVLGGGTLIIALSIGSYCLWRRRDQNDKLVNHPVPPRPQYQPTVTDGPGPGSIYLWNNGVPVGAPPSVASYRPPVSEYSGSTVHEVIRPERPFHELSGGSNQTTGQLRPRPY
ncbi:hypothetical protein K504DRAFT_435623 [Pleomassaria siparia CBS 279.74]|uniref:Mid2 domain-containing protein n=1 Tax=Pleomassaria siparia CBS 279.74 TaxID=1314801 RepID=A0A6G1K498_9PLEO|nr:hypothetical protein K504DRAFT_435623 [Pleomassaria siparia CBS 279.74]